MNPQVLTTRRGIHPQESVAGCLPDYRLVFNTPGLPWIEPAFANVEPAPGRLVHGVLHRLTQRQLNRLDLFEGGGLAYRHLKLEVHAYDGRKIVARVYSARRLTKEKNPSCRYLDILREGAHYHQLDPAYIRMLCDHPCGSRIRLPSALFHGLEVLLGDGKPVRSLIQTAQRVMNSVVKRGSKPK